MSSLQQRLASTIACAAALLCAGTPASGAAAAVERIADGVYLLRGEFDPARQPDGNSVVFAGARGLAVVDTGRHAAHTRALLDFAAARGLPIALAINSHWHLDHLGGNALLRQQIPGLRVLADARSDIDMGIVFDTLPAQEALRAAFAELHALEGEVIALVAQRWPDLELGAVRERGTQPMCRRWTDPTRPRGRCVLRPRAIA